MDSITVVMLLVAGFFGGGLSALVGGASIVTFPTLLATGMSAIAATVAGLVALTPTRWFELMIPLLLGFATVLFAFAPRISDHLRARSRARSGREPHISVTSIPMLLPVAVYGGYFGAGVGVLLLAVLSVATAGDYRTANVTKNLVSGINSIVVTGFFWASGAIPWRETLVLMAGAIVGGLGGAHLSRIAPTWIMRIVVVLVGAALTVAYTWRYWF